MCLPCSLPQQALLPAAERDGAAKKKKAKAKAQAKAKAKKLTKAAAPTRTEKEKKGAGGDALTAASPARATTTKGCFAPSTSAKRKQASAGKHAGAAKRKKVGAKAAARAQPEMGEVREGASSLADLAQVDLERLLLCRSGVAGWSRAYPSGAVFEDLVVGGPSGLSRPRPADSSASACL